MNEGSAVEPLPQVAIIGMAGRFPRCPSVDELWRQLCDGAECISRFSDAELRAAGIGAATLADPAYVKAGALLDDIDRFDAPFFRFSSREAEMTDPQHRVFLECAWEALENAGYDPDRYPGAIGVFAGSGMSRYLPLLYADRELVRAVGTYRLHLGNDKDFLPTLASYKLNLRGPSLSVQTACSTSLVAVHLAVQSLLNGECDMALAGGVSITVLRKSGYFYREGGISSPDGHCRAFDAAARGTVGGNGAGVVVLKRLAEALADGDSIRAVVLGSAINNDGAQKVGFTAPGLDGQARVIREALAVAGVEPRTLGYVEAHGTGTSLGDPIEVAALTEAFDTDERGFCALGSLKTNLGHLDVAAGAAGLIKTVLALEHGLLPPSLHFERPNPEIDFAASPFYVNTTLAPWRRDGAPRRAGVSAFGIGGTNAHVVLEEAPSSPPGDPAPEWHLLPLSAETEPALDRAAAALAEHLARHPGLDLADVAFTLQVGRRHCRHRRALVCRDREEALALLAGASGSAARLAGERRAVAFLFPGQGAQHPGMAAAIYRREPRFQAEVDRCCAFLAPRLGVDLRGLLVPDSAGSAREEAVAALRRTELAQPALFVTEYALARLWMAWGVHPGALLGHSLGEYVAACIAGVFSLEDALALVAVRGRLMAAAPA
jgi:acyl transferase domain-containing protein